MSPHTCAGVHGCGATIPDLGIDPDGCYKHGGESGHGLFCCIYCLSLVSPLTSSYGGAYGEDHAVWRVLVSLALWRPRPPCDTAARQGPCSELQLCVMPCITCVLLGTVCTPAAAQRPTVTPAAGRTNTCCWNFGAASHLQALSHALCLRQAMSCLGNLCFAAGHTVGGLPHGPCGPATPHGHLLHWHGT